MREVGEGVRASVPNLLDLVVVVLLVLILGGGEGGGGGGGGGGARASVGGGRSPRPGDSPLVALLRRHGAVARTVPDDAGSPAARARAAGAFVLALARAVLLAGLLALLALAAAAAWRRAGRPALVGRSRFERLFSAGDDNDWFGAAVDDDARRRRVTLKRVGLLWETTMGDAAAVDDARRRRVEACWATLGDYNGRLLDGGGRLIGETSGGGRRRRPTHAEPVGTRSHFTKA